MFLTLTILGQCGMFKNMEPAAYKDEKFNTAAKLALTTAVTDSLFFMSSFVVGILTAQGTIQEMSPAASYAHIGFSVAVALSWILPGLIKKSRNN